MQRHGLTAHQIRWHHALCTPHSRSRLADHGLHVVCERRVEKMPAFGHMEGAELHVNRRDWIQDPYLKCVIILQVKLIFRGLCSYRGNDLGRSRSGAGVGAARGFFLMAQQWISGPNPYQRFILRRTLEPSRFRSKK